MEISLRYQVKGKAVRCAAQKRSPWAGLTAQKQALRAVSVGVPPHPRAWVRNAAYGPERALAGLPAP